MITKIQNISLYNEFIKALKNDPIFSDPHFVYDSNNLFEASNKLDQTVLGVFENNELIGIFVLLILTNENYIEVLISLSKNKNAYDEFFIYLIDNYSGYNIDFVINPKNYLLKNKLKENYASFENEQIKMIYQHLVGENNIKTDIRLYSDSYKEEYIYIHSQDCYWTGEKVINALDKFRVLLAFDNNELIGYLDITYCFDENEPYDLFVKDGYDERIKRDLLIKAIQLNNNNKIMLLTDVNDIDTINLYKSVGFIIVENQNSITAHVVL